MSDDVILAEWQRLYQHGHLYDARLTLSADVLLWHGQPVAFISHSPTGKKPWKLRVGKERGVDRTLAFTTLERLFNGAWRFELPR